jgi:hypothetical protein
MSAAVMKVAAQRLAGFLRLGSGIMTQRTRTLTSDKPTVILQSNSRISRRTTTGGLANWARTQVPVAFRGSRDPLDETISCEFPGVQSLCTTPLPPDPHPSETERPVVK